MRERTPAALSSRLRSRATKWPLAACLVAALGGACAAAPAHKEVRILVTLAAPPGDGASIARDAEIAARTPVRYLAAVSPSRHALAIVCGAASDCAAALQRLRADTARFAEVEIDERKARH